ncbi:hypothetical protein GINT2_001100 [Glugoides intestinalis]
MILSLVIPFISAINASRIIGSNLSEPCIGENGDFSLYKEIQNLKLFDTFYNNVDVNQTSVGLIYPPISVTSTDNNKEGELSVAYRKSMKNLCNKKFGCEFKRPFSICTKKSLCRNLTKEQFYKAVVHTIKVISGKKDMYIPENTSQVIDSIYIAAVAANATVDQLINFTSIALHNVYLFLSFPVANANNTLIGNTPRGLLQLLSLIAYEAIDSVSETNYIQRPYLLDTFTKVSIQDEVMTFMKYYSRSNLHGIESFIESVRVLKSAEAPLMNMRAAVAVLNRTYVPQNILEQRVLNRFNIYYTLSANLFSSQSLFVSSFEN